MNVHDTSTHQAAAAAAGRQPAPVPFFASVNGHALATVVVQARRK